MNSTTKKRIAMLERTMMKPAEALQIIVITAPGLDPGCAMLPATGGHVVANEGETEVELIERVKKDHLGDVKAVAVLSPEDLQL